MTQWKQFIIILLISIIVVFVPDFNLNIVSILPITKETNSRISVMKRPESEDGIEEDKDLFTDNIMLSSGTIPLYTGFYGIVKRGLTHLAIPNGWTWGGVASEHCPVWSEFYTTNQIESTNTLNGIREDD